VCNICARLCVCVCVRVCVDRPSPSAFPFTRDFGRLTVVLDLDETLIHTSIHVRGGVVCVCFMCVCLCVCAVVCPCVYVDVCVY